MTDGQRLRTPGVRRWCSPPCVLDLPLNDRSLPYAPASSHPPARSTRSAGALYARWREAKCAIIRVGSRTWCRGRGPAGAYGAEHAEIVRLCRGHMAVYASRPRRHGRQGHSASPRRAARPHPPRSQPAGRRGRGDVVAGRSEKGGRGYIPYTTAGCCGTTDGYLQRARGAASRAYRAALRVAGRERRRKCLARPEIAYIRLRDQDPELVARSWTRRP